MHRKWVAVAVATMVASASADSAWAQVTAAGQPILLAQGESGGATSGGAASEAPAPAVPAAGATQTDQTPAPTPEAQELPAGPAAGPAAPSFFANPFVVGGAVVTAGVICALACFGSSSSTTTTSSHH